MHVSAESKPVGPDLGNASEGKSWLQSRSVVFLCVRENVN